MTVLNRYSRKGLARALYAGVSAGALGGAAVAQTEPIEPPLTLQTDYFGYAATVAGRVGYSDNIRLQPDGRERDETILSTIFSGGAITSTNRFTGLLVGDLDFSYLIDENDFNVNQDIGATGTLTLADNWLYLDVSGKTQRQLIGDNARFSRNINSARNEQASVHSLAASPYLFHRRPDNSTLTLRYRFSQIFVDDSESDFGGINQSFLNDSQSQEILANYSSGRLLDRVRFSLTAYGNDTQESGSAILPEFGYRIGTLEGAAEVALSRQFALSGAVGYDEVETDDAAALFFDDEELSGLYWRAGFTARPNRRTRARIQYGERYGDDFIDADISYRLTQRTDFRAGAQRSFRSRAQTINSRFRDTQIRTLQFADLLRQGEELSPRGVVDAANQYSSLLSGVSAQTIGVGIVDSAFASLNTQYERTDISLTANYSDADFGFRQIDTLSINGLVDRDLSRQASAYVGVSFRRADTFVDTATCEANPLVFGLNAFDPLFDPVVECADLAASNGVTNTVSGVIGVDYRFFENVSGFAEYSHAQRWSEIDDLEYGENTIFVGLRLDL